MSVYDKYNAGIDFKQQSLCEPRWNGRHWFTYGNDKITGDPIRIYLEKPKGGCHSGCLQGGCECHCLQLMKERPKRKKAIKDEQLTIDDAVGSITP